MPSSRRRLCPTAGFDEIGQVAMGEEKGKRKGQVSMVIKQSRAAGLTVVNVLQSARVSSLLYVSKRQGYSQPRQGRCRR